MAIIESMLKVPKTISIYKNNSILGDSRNYTSPILGASSVKRIATQMLVIAKLNERPFN